jgi:hypothetical protein
VEKSKKVLFSKEDEARYTNIVLPSWIAAFSTGNNVWKTPDDNDRSSLLNFCERVFGEEFARKFDFTDGSDVWKKVSTVTIATMLLIPWFLGEGSLVTISQSHENPGISSSPRGLRNPTF